MDVTRLRNEQGENQDMVNQVPETTAIFYQGKSNVRVMNYKK